MARKTKEEAQATRELILDTAETVFLAHGVSRTSLQAIAQSAGVTRGAIYWHFKNKSDLFQAMVDRVTKPFFASWDAHSTNSAVQPLERLRTNLRMGLSLVAQNERGRRVFAIVSFKLEYVDEMQGIYLQYQRDRVRFMQEMQFLLDLAQEQGQLRPQVSVRAAVVGLDALMAGLLRNWLLDPSVFDIEGDGMATVDMFLSGIAQ
ncbi:TetR family transcriptional regulator [Curvibacter sp. CHRR-16]|uniref:TetR family transcriptional regulator n=1 Tax=Curvibacter sp. CHRR-16 TaxID=2835872 RepID=UPI001BD97A47|nr:TetR family transcriptional regulator [Curvibacter sp. CHRR-16]MBT0569702.1 TetR family transcriptional regulator [Curvibacter sp. CHRR-16]